MTSQTFRLFRMAILEQKQVTLFYQGFHREVCPHLLGWKDGREKVLTYQFAGGSSTGLPPGGEWRCLFLDEIEEIRLRAGPWRTGHADSRPETCITRIDTEVRQ